MALRSALLLKLGASPKELARRLRHTALAMRRVASGGPARRRSLRVREDILAPKMPRP
jgi:hypothetical protein